MQHQPVDRVRSPVFFISGSTGIFFKNITDRAKKSRINKVIVFFFRLLWLLDSQEIGAALRKFGGRRPLGNMRAEGPPRKFGARRAPKKSRFWGPQEISGNFGISFPQEMRSGLIQAINPPPFSKIWLLTLGGFFAGVGILIIPIMV